MLTSYTFIYIYIFNISRLCADNPWNVLLHAPCILMGCPHRSHLWRISSPTKTGGWPQTQHILKSCTYSGWFGWWQEWQNVTFADCNTCKCSTRGFRNSKCWSPLTWIVQVYSESSSSLTVQLHSLSRLLMLLLISRLSIFSVVCVRDQGQGHTA